MNALITAILMGMAAASGAAAASELSGTVDRVTYDAMGRVDGVILKDRSYVRFSPEMALFNSAFQPDGHLDIRGSQVLSSPNRVFQRVLIKVDKRELVDDTQAAKEASPALPDALQAVIEGAMAAYRANLPLYVVGAKADGQVDRIVLQDGTTVEIPRGAKLGLSGLAQDAKMSVVGVSTSLSNGRFVVALSIKNAEKEELLHSASKGAGAWQFVQGVIKETLHNPNGDVAGVSLVDGTVVHITPMIPSIPTAKLKAGAAVEVAGPGKNHQMFSQIVILSKDDTAINSDAPAMKGGGRGRR